MSKIPRRLNKVGKHVGGLGVAVAYLSHQPHGPRNSRRVYLDVDRPVYSRYLYSLAKFFEIEGFEVALRCRPETLFAMKRSEYASWVLSERLCRLRVGGAPDLGGVNGRRRLIPTNFLPAADPRGLAVYDVPMAQHPRMYAEGLWNQPVGTADSDRTGLLFAGNADRAVYATSTRLQQIFDTIDRITLWSSLAGRADTEVVEECARLSSEASGVVLADTRCIHVPPAAFRQLMGGFRYFLAAPGAYMPLCHNLIEALSVGAVPLIQRTYASLMPEGLEHGRNAFVFDGVDGLHRSVDAALSLPVTSQSDMSAEALSYYEANLAPGAVTQRVLDPAVGTVRLLAGQHSVSLMRR